jgi:hypothetical protein
VVELERSTAIVCASCGRPVWIEVHVVLQREAIKIGWHQ